MEESVYHCGDCVVDAANRRFVRAGVDVVIEPRVFAVILELLRRAGSLVTRSELLERVWGHAYVTPSTLSRAITLARRAFDDDPERPRYIQTVYGAGYQFVGPVVRVARPPRDRQDAWGGARAMQDQLTGRCLCGAVRYRCGSPLYPPTLCHCESCRRASGAHALGWLTVRVEDLHYTQGRPVEFQSSPGRHRAFCSQCGSPLTYRSDLRPGEVDVTLGTLDAPAQAAPGDHIWMEDAPSWDVPGDGRPQYPRGRHD